MTLQELFIEYMTRLPQFANIRGTPSDEQVMQSLRHFDLAKEADLEIKRLASTGPRDVVQLDEGEELADIYGIFDKSLGDDGWIPVKYVIVESSEEPYAMYGPGDAGNPMYGRDPEECTFHNGWTLETFQQVADYV